MNDDLLIRVPAKLEGRMEVVRSFSYKLNVGNYESRDFFCSAKGSCDAADVDSISLSLDEYVQAQVLASVKEYRSKLNSQRERNAT
jgi:hypothetical protein